MHRRMDTRRDVILNCSRMENAFNTNKVASFDGWDGVIGREGIGPKESFCIFADNEIGISVYRYPRCLAVRTTLAAFFI